MNKHGTVEYYLNDNSMLKSNYSIIHLFGTHPLLWCFIVKLWNDKELMLNVTKLVLQSNEYQLICTDKS